MFCGCRVHTWYTFHKFHLTLEATDAGVEVGNA